MAVITISGNYGKGAFQNLGLSFNNAKEKTSSMASSLGSLRSKIYIAQTVVNVGTSSKSASDAVNREEHKKSALSIAYKKLDKLLVEIGTVDNKVAEAIDSNKKIFYKKFSWLKPECEKGFFEKAKDYLWGKICDIGNALKNIAISVGKWLKEHWKEILIGLAAIVVGAILTVLTGGAATFLAAFVSGLLKAAAFAAIEGAISGTVTYVGARMNGMSPKEALNASLTAFGDSFASGFATAGLTFGGAAAGKYIGKTYKWYNRIQKASKGVSYVKKGFDTFEQVGGFTSALWPDSDVAKMYKSITSNSFYKYTKKGVKYTSIFLSSASKSAVITDDSYMKDGKKLANVRYQSPTGTNGAIYETDKHGKATTEMFYKTSQSYRRHAKEDWGIGSGYEKYEMNDHNRWEYKGFKSDIYDKDKIFDKFKDQGKDVILGKNKYISSGKSSNSTTNIMGIQIPSINIPQLNISGINFTQILVH